MSSGIPQNGISSEFFPGIPSPFVWDNFKRFWKIRRNFIIPAEFPFCARNSAARYTELYNSIYEFMLRIKIIPYVLRNFVGIFTEIQLNILTEFHGIFPQSFMPLEKFRGIPRIYSV